MKIVFLAAALALAPIAASAQSNTSSFFDRNGRFSGSSVEVDHGRGTSVYDSRGRFDGSATRNSDGTTSFYDRNGHFTGSRRDTTQPR